MKQRKYLPGLGDLIDRLSISQQKELYIPRHRKIYTKEISDIVHDIGLILGKRQGEFIRAIIICTQMNAWIWQNEANWRKGIRKGNKLELTHGLNGIRSAAKNKIQEKIGGRKDYKLDNVKAFKQWIPSGY